MKVRPRIAIVAGELTEPRLLKLFEPLRDMFDPTIYALYHERLIDKHARHGTGIKLRIFENVPDMPGYLGGLEEELAGAEAIVALETSRLASFQAVRAARKYGVPLGIVTTEHRPYFYEKFANIRAIQFDIVNKAERFWPTTQLAAQCLRLDQVAPDAMRILPPVVDLQRFKPNPEGRARFRKYIGVGEREQVILYRQDLHAAWQPDAVLRAFALLNQRGLGKDRPLRLIFCGNGAEAMQLKYGAYDLGLGRTVMFLHQDPEPFLVDLYAASDAMISPRPLGLDFHEDLPLQMLEAMAVGCAPVVQAGTVAAELAGEAASVYGEATREAIAAALTPLFMDQSHLEAMQRRAARKVALDNDASGMAELICAEITRLIDCRMARPDVAAGVPLILAAIEAALVRKDLTDVLLQCEEALLLAIPSAKDRASVLRMKGEALYAQGDITTAGEVFSESARLFDGDARTLRGLGFVAWQGHSNEEALMFFKRAHGLKDDDLEVMLGLGLVYRRLGLLEEAIFWLEKCLASEDYPSAALSALAQACAQTPRTEHGIEVLERALEVVGESKIVMMTLGQLYLNQGRSREGHEMLEKALGDVKENKAS